VKTAIMQPYFFPYVGYYQLINAVDIFVLLDDVNFIKRGWINRNNILLNNEAHLFSIPLEKPSQNKLICETKLNFSIQDKEHFIKTFELAYKKAPFFKDFFPIFTEIILYENNDLTDFLCNSFIKTFRYLEIKKKIIRSSEIQKNNTLKAEERIIEICKKLDTVEYINLSGGKSLYSRENFAKENMELRFIETHFDNIHYKQFNNGFVPNLSFFDIIMFNQKNEVKKILDQYSLVGGV